MRHKDFEGSARRVLPGIPHRYGHFAPQTSTSLRCEMPMSMGKALTEPDHVPSSFQATVNYVGAPPASRRSWPGYALLPSPSLPICPSHPHHGRGGTLQSVLPPEYADASFHAGPEREGPLEPGSFFVLLTLFG